MILPVSDVLLALEGAAAATLVVVALRADVAVAVDVDAPDASVFAGAADDCCEMAVVVAPAADSDVEAQLEAAIAALR